ncbi:acetyl-CoA acetyltransferase [Halosolutus amylolyticus]|nr:acetyl-CoA acetyltransferase [Halosolutus amylolyticus]
MSTDPIIAGVGESELGKTPDRTWIDNAAVASVRALNDAGLDLDAVDGVAVAGANDDLPTLLLGEYLGIDHPQYMDGTEIGGSAFERFVETAARSMESGNVDVVVIAYGSTQRTAGEGTPEIESSHPVDQFAELAGTFTPVSQYALATQRHMHEHGTTEAQLAEIAVSTREWASMNPKAARRDPLTVDDVLSSPPVSAPLKQLDCCLVSDGGGALVLVSPEKAAELDSTNVAISGAASTQTHRKDMSQMPDLTSTGATETGPRAFEQAGIDVDDVDVAEIYDSFTYTVLTTLEDLGFCDQGAGGEFVEGGTLGPDGSLPTNTHGGGLSYCHPGHFGIFLLIEAVRQLRGEYDGKRQVPDATTAVAHGTGGVLSSSSTVVLERRGQP